MRDLKVLPQTFFIAPDLARRMYLCYLDESGVPQSNPGTTDYFVLLGLAIPAVRWRERDVEINGILNSHNLYGEVHTAWMARMYPEQERVIDFDRMDPEERRQAVAVERRKDLALASARGRGAVNQLSKNYQKTQAYLHLSHSERLSILRACADAIGRWEDAALFADAQRKTANPGGPDRVLDHAFEQVVTRFHHFLERNGLPVGIVVQDQNETASRRLTSLARRFHDRGTTYIPVPRLVETPLFVDSKLTTMVQLADLGAYAVRRFFENGETDLFDRLYPAFDRVHGRLVGLRHYTGRQRCRCRVCVDHGRIAE